MLEANANLAGFQLHARRKAGEFLSNNGAGRLDQQMRLLQASPAETFEGGRQPAASLALVITRLAGGDPAEMGNQFLPVGQAVGAEAFGNARRQDLLGAPAAHTEQKRQGG